MAELQIYKKYLFVQLIFRIWCVMELIIYRSPSPYDDRRGREYSPEPPIQYNPEGNHHKDTRYDQQVAKSRREQLYSTSRHHDSYNDQRDSGQDRERSPLNRLKFPHIWSDALSFGCSCHLVNYAFFHLFHVFSDLHLYKHQAETIRLIHEVQDLDHHLNEFETQIEKEVTNF